MVAAEPSDFLRLDSRRRALSEVSDCCANSPSLHRGGRTSEPRRDGPNRRKHEFRLLTGQAFTDRTQPFRSARRRAGGSTSWAKESSRSRQVPPWRTILKTRGSVVIAKVPFGRRA